MKTYIALLRGINVTGYNKIKMVDLRALLESIHLQHVTTYIQSGNILFESEIVDPQLLEEMILKAIKNKYGYTINIVVLTKEQLQVIYRNNPYLIKGGIDIGKLCVTLLKSTPEKRGLDALKLIAGSGEEFQLKDQFIYMHLPNGFGRTKLTNNIIEKKLKSPATTRNWRTITKLAELSQQYP